MRFEKVSFEAFRKDGLKYGWTEEAIRVAYDNVKLPERKTKYSAGYDFFSPLKFTLNPGHQITIPTGIKVVFRPEEKKMWHLCLYIRSSVGITRQVVMSNQTGIIDPDFADNPDNEGDMLIALKNLGDHYRHFNVGDRVIQGVFKIHGITEDDNAEGERTGGVGSTDGKETR